jgi:hypothetical protein
MMMSDFPPRVDSLRAQIMVGLPEADFLIEEIWKTSGHDSGRVSQRFWRVSIQTGRNSLPTIIDVPDKVLLEDSKFATKLVTASPNLIITPSKKRRS